MSDLKTLGGYKINKAIAQGGVALVYRASSGNQWLALKVLLPAFQRDTLTINRFIHEAKVMTRFNHPHILRVYHEAKQEQGNYYFPMEYLPGGDLASQLEKLFQQTGYGLTMRESLEVTIQAAKGLHFTHERGYVHRDVKPHNLLLSDKGEIKLSDFGIALDMRSQPIEYNITGTLAYMAPEQIRDKNSVNQRADIYALGVVLYELLAGRLPYEGIADEGLMRAKVYDLPPPVTRFNNVVPNDLQKIVERALMAQPDQRYQNIVELERALEDVKNRLTPTQAETRPANKGQGPAKVNQSMPHLIGHVAQTPAISRPTSAPLSLPLIVVAVVAFIIIFVLFNNREPAVSSLPTDTPSPTPTETFTPTPSPTKPITPTVRLSTPIPPTLAVDIPAVTVSPTNLFTATPILLEPTSNTQIFSDKMTMFRWQWSGILPENYNFEVCIWLDKADVVHMGAYDVKKTVPQNNNGIYAIEFKPSGAESVKLHRKQDNYFWSVKIVQVEPYSETGIESLPVRVIIHTP